MTKFELYVPRAYQAPPRRGLALVRAFALALLVFGLAFGVTFLLEPTQLASQESAAPAAPAAVPCLPAKLARQDRLVVDRPARPAARHDRVARNAHARPRRQDGDAESQLVRIANPADGPVGGGPDLDGLAGAAGAVAEPGDAGRHPPSPGEAGAPLGDAGSVGAELIR